MQRDKMIAMADKLIQMGEEIRNELIHSECTIYFYFEGQLTSKTWKTWKTDEEVVEYLESKYFIVGKWWR